MSRLFADNLKEHSAVLAYHYSEGGVPEQAAHYFLAAGRQAMRLSAHLEAISHYSRALECLRQVDNPPSDDWLQAYGQLGRAYELVWDHDAADQTYIEMQAFAEDQNDLQLHLAALLARTTIYNTFTPKLDPVHGRELADETLQLARQMNDAESQAKIYWSLMLMHGFVQDYRTGRPVL